VLPANERLREPKFAADPADRWARAPLLTVVVWMLPPVPPVVNPSSFRLFHSNPHVNSRAI
jgi:hypothetical protein